MREPPVVEWYGDCAVVKIWKTWWVTHGRREKCKTVGKAKTAWRSASHRTELHAMNQPTENELARAAELEAELYPTAAEIEAELNPVESRKRIERCFGILREPEDDE